MALRGTLTHRKTRRLARLLGISAPCALGVMEALWHVTAGRTPDGAIGKLSDLDIAEEMFWEGDAGTLVAAFVEAELLDAHPSFRLVVHDWHAHADDAVHMLLARRGMRFANGDLPRMTRLSQAERAKAQAAFEREEAHASRTDEHAVQPCAHKERTPCAPPEPDPEPCHAMPEPDSHTPTMEALHPPNPPQGGERVRVSTSKLPADWENHWRDFLEVYPDRNGDRKVSNGREVFRRILATGADPGPILEGVKRYRHWADATLNTRTSYVKQITSWLNSRSWEEPWNVPAGPVRGSPNGTAARPSLEQRKNQILAELAEMP